MNFFEKFFIYPTTHLTGYNIINTCVYAVIFILAAYILYKIIEYKKIEINSKFVLSALPFAIFGILYRLQVDYHKFSPSFYTVTPGCWIIAFALWLLVVVLSDRECYFKNALIIGILLILSSSIVFTLKISNYMALLLYILLFGLVIESLLINNFYILAFIGEYTDAITSYLGIKEGMFEEHVISRFLIKISPEVYLITKITLTILVILAIYKTDISTNLKRYLCSVIFILGFGPGSRNWFLLLK